MHSTAQARGRALSIVAATSFRRGETKNRPQSFASRKKTVSHRLVERERVWYSPWAGSDPARGRSLSDESLKILFEIHGMSKATDA